ncbi:18676_t:CDS:2, partial [Racocetra fulgida]
AQQMQEMKIGYNKLATLLTTQAEANNLRMRPPARITMTVEANYSNIDDDYDLEREVFTGERYQPYQHQNNNYSPNSKSQWEGHPESTSILILNNGSKKLYQPEEKVNLKGSISDEDDMFDQL